MLVCPLLQVPQFVYAFQTLEYLFRHIHRTKPYTLLMGLISFTSLYALSWWKRKQKALAEVRVRSPPPSITTSNRDFFFVHEP